MKSHTEYLTFHTPARMGFRNITPLVEEIVRKSGVAEGLVLCVTQGKLDFGPWEQIFYGEFDGNRPKRVLVKVIGE